MHVSSPYISLLLQVQAYSSFLLVLLRAEESIRVAIF